VSSDTIEPIDARMERDKITLETITTPSGTRKTVWRRDGEVMGRGEVQRYLGAQTRAPAARLCEREVRLDCLRLALRVDDAVDADELFLAERYATFVLTGKAPPPASPGVMVYFADGSSRWTPDPDIEAGLIKAAVDEASAGLSRLKAEREGEQP